MLRIEKTAFSSTLQSVITGNPSNQTIPQHSIDWIIKHIEFIVFLKALAHYEDFYKIFTTKIFTTIFPKKSLRKSLPIYKTVEKIFAVVKKSYSVYGR